MSLTTFNTNYLKGSYTDDVTFLLKIAENAPLAMGTNTSGLHPHIDGKQNLAIGYGYDFAANGANQSIDDLKVAGAKITDEAKSIGLRPHFSHLIALPWLLGLTTLALCSFNTHADDIKSMHKIEFNKTPPKAILSELLQSSHYANESPPNMAYYEEFDLNNDNSNEYFLYINDPGWCGSGNCPMFIFEKKGGIIRPLLEVSSGPIVYILNHKINGYYDISFFPDGEVNRNIWHWNGKQYK